VDHADNKPTYAEDYFKDAFYTEEERMKHDEDRIGRARARLEKKLRMRADYVIIRGMLAAKQVSCFYKFVRY
jgi:hypothetical protein